MTALDEMSGLGECPFGTLRGPLEEPLIGTQPWAEDLMGAASGEGVRVLTIRAPNAVYEGNLIVTPQPWLYGSGNTHVAGLPTDTRGFGVR